MNLAASCVPKAEMTSAHRTVSARREQTVTLGPLTHPRWDSLVSAHPGGSSFHGSAGARVLHDTYGHQIAFGNCLESMRTFYSRHCQRFLFLLRNLGLDKTEGFPPHEKNSRRDLAEKVAIDSGS